MNYLHWDEQTISDFSDAHISDMYDRGFVFTRKGRGVMQQTRSVRINLEKFSPSSENRRILKKVEGIKLTTNSIPFDRYTFELGKLAKDFYDTKFEPGIMSAQKVKEMLTDSPKSNFTTLFSYNDIGFSICYENSQILHYSYPFYDLSKSSKDMGLGMMTLAIQYAKEKGLKYIYLGSLQRSSDSYKLQFEGLEWFDGKEWKNDLEEVKKILKSDPL